MKNVSKEFRENIYKGAPLYQTAKIEFADGREKELGKKDFYLSGNGFSDGPGANAFPLGEAMSKHITMVLVNDDDRFSDYDFYMAKIRVWLKCDLSETTESIFIGTFTVTTPESYGSQVTVDAIDDMYKGNEAYTTEISYPATLGTILRDSCLTCGVNLLSTAFSNNSFVVEEQPDDITHRQLWGMIAMLAGGNARMDENNYLGIIEYDFSYFEKAQLNGGYFDAAIPYASGDDAYGGNFTDWSSGDSFDGGDFAELNDFHMFYRAKIPTITTDDVVITGIQTTVDEETYLFGSEGYVLNIENPLISNNPGGAVELIGSKIVGLRFRPFTIDHMAYPLAEFGDLCYIADRKGNVYQSVVTDVSFNFFGYTTISCSADDPLRNSSKYYAINTETIVKARKEIKKQLSAYDLAVQQLTNLITNSFGVFKTEEKLEDGSVIYYLHDRTELTSSKKIWKMTADAFAVSSDGGKTWNAGLDNEGNAVVNVLSAIGINAEWLIAGLISDAKGINWWNLDTCEFRLAATTMVGDSTVASQQNVADAKDSAYLYADNAVNELDNLLTMQNVFNRLTNNGLIKGLFMKDGELYINANYILTGILTDATGTNSWDMDNGIFSLASTTKVGDSTIASAAEVSVAVKASADAMNATVSKKVGADEIISKINQSAEDVAISAGKIRLEGAVTVNDNVKINTNGTIETKGATLDGTVTSGKIIVTDGYMDVRGNYTSPSGNTPSQILIRPSASTSADSSVMNYLGLYFNSADLSGGRSVELLASRDLIFYTASDKAAWGTWIDETGVWSQSLTVSGTKSRYAETEDYGERLFYCYEMPTPMFGDIGEGKIDETGKCYIFLDDIFTETIDTDCVYQVFLQPYGKGECYITERTSSYFVVEGTTDLSFGWELKAVQKGYDTMRMEVFEKVPKECDTLMEIETYLNTMVETDGTIEETETYLDSLANTDGTMEETEEYLTSVIDMEESEEQI